MKEKSAGLLEKALRALAAADFLLRMESTEAAANRAYYAMFYAAEALLYEKGLEFRRHSGVHGGFGTQFIKTGLLDSKHHRAFLDAFDRRVTADYAVGPVLSTKGAARTVQDAHEFLDAARVLLTPPAEH